MTRPRPLGCLAALAAVAFTTYVVWTALFYFVADPLPVDLFLYNADDTPLNVVSSSDGAVIATAPPGDVGIATLRMYDEPYASFLHALLWIEPPMPDIPVRIQTARGRDLWSGPPAESWTFGRRWEVLATEANGAWKLVPARDADGDRVGPF